MIRKTKKQLYKLIVYPLLLVLFYAIVPYVLSSHFKLRLTEIILVFGIPNFLIIYFLIHYHSRRLSALILDMQKMQESINIVDNHTKKQNEFIAGFAGRINRYNSLKSLIERINQEFELESISKSLLDSIFELIGKRRGNCILYLVDPDTQKLEIYATKKEHPRLVIKAKQGDIFDYWVLKHTTTLLIEDIKKDFRFDLEKIEDEHSRPIGSLISAPLVSQERVLGVIRLDNYSAFAYTQNDQRFLNTIADLASVAIENSKLFKETQELAIRDSLTSCYTRKYLLDRLKEEFRRSIKKKNDISLLMIDIDNFKVINDTHGHPTGDLILKALAKIFASNTRKVDIVARYGGEEFVVIYPELDMRSKEFVSERLRIKVENYDFSKVTGFPVDKITISIGYAVFPTDGTTVDDLCLSSDKALYRAKRMGKNMVCYVR